VRRIVAIPILLCFLALGTGTMGHLHALDHQREDAALARGTGAPADRPVHNDSNCLIHAQLHMPMVSIGWVPLLVCLGLLIAFLTLAASPLVSQRTPTAFNCRGPPASR
jgi:hypothetical protein